MNADEQLEINDLTADTIENGEQENSDNENYVNQKKITQFEGLS
ncbi:unnamed protein product, partial [Larinioides sclopetarius]